MTNILNWNIQNGRGVDGRVSFKRIASIINTMDTPDVICLQEISRHLPLEHDEDDEDHVDTISKLLPGYELIFGIAIDAKTDKRKGRWQFGNAILSRLPILSVISHPLPQPAAGGVKHMARQMTEVNVDTELGPIRIMTTHLEYHATHQRCAQVTKLNDIHTEIIENRLAEPAVSSSGPNQEIVRPENSILCGDFNIGSNTREYIDMCRTFKTGQAPLYDAWKVLNPKEPHSPTCGIYDNIIWPQGAHCRDYFFVTESLIQSIKRLEVDIDTDASDHQPMLLTLSAR